MDNLMLDVFNQDAFSMINLTLALQKLPYQERQLGTLGIFDYVEGVETGSVLIDELQGQLQILTSRPRGSDPERAHKEIKAKARSVAIPHFQFEDRIEAASLFGKRQPGEATLQSVVRKVNDRQMYMRDQVETTNEVHRLNALRGILLDSDGSTIQDFFALFGVSQIVSNYALTSPTLDVRGTIVKNIRQIELELGGVPYTGITAICGKNFFDNLTSHPNVKQTYQLAEANILREDLRKTGWTFGGVTWLEYRGMRNFAGDLAKVNDDEAIMFPTGVSRMLRTYHAPADFLETVGTVGMPMYAKASPDLKYNRWVDLLVETNPLFINTRPRAVLRITQS